MSNKIYQIPNRKLMNEEAGSWLIKLDGDTQLTPAQQQALREWLMRSPLHREELNDLAAFWGKMNILTELAVPLGKLEMQPKRDVFLRASWLLSGFSRAGVGAAILVIVVVIALTTRYAPDALTVSNGHYQTTVGQQQTISLIDGSVIQLNTNSEMVVMYNDQRRNLYLLRGEAHFSVAKNASRPFRVYAGSGRIQAVGTAFSVRLKGQGVEVTVTEGSVALASLNALDTVVPPLGSDRPPISRDSDSEGYVKNLKTLEAGQSTTINRRSINDSIAQSSLQVIQNIDQQELVRRLSWRQGLLIFTGEPLQDVVDEISRYTITSIDIVDPEVSAIKIGGQFRIGETEAMFDALEENFGLRVIHLGDNHVQLAAAKDL